MRVPLVPALILFGLVTGCAAPVHPVPTTVVTPGMPNPEEAMLSSMQRVNAEMAELGQLTPTPVTTSAGQVIPEDLQRIVSFSWNGPLDQAVAKVALSIGYTFYTTAPPDAKPVTIAIQLNSVPAYQVFQALGEEAGALATVEVDPLHHQIQVIHHVV
jgi:defect-in-organelle-trafficking protein DotD